MRANIMRNIIGGPIAPPPIMPWPIADGEACARPLPNRTVKTSLVLATILVVVALGFDFIAPLFLNS
jgi:hypothetical protein